MAKRFIPKRWSIHSHDPSRIAALSQAAGIPAVVAQLLICRGITDPADAKVFLDPKLTALRDPELLPGCADAAARIHAAIQDGKRIIVYGDYDVDGMTGSALLVLCLKLLGGNVGYYIPNRIDEGYGLNEAAIRAKADEGAQLIISVDCGIGSLDEAAVAREVGVELIITDHHEPGEELPDASAIVHPRLPGAGYPFGGLSGSGVALKLAWALCQQAAGAKRVGQKMRDFLMQAVGFASMGTVADVVPLVDENRVLVCHGLRSLSQYPSLGISTLMKVTQLHAKKQLDSEDIGYTIGPRLNAAGRLGQPQLGVELLVTENAERARELAEYIHELNDNRQTLERSIVRAAGEKYHRPVVVISFDPLGIKPGVGSARSVPGFNLYAALKQCDEFLLGCGGHTAAAGLQIEESQLEGFRAAFCEVAAREISEENRVGQLNIDAEAALSEFTLASVRQIERLEPFGEANPRPLLCASNVTLARPPKTMGKDGNHLNLELDQHGVRLRAVAFGAGEWAEELTNLNGPIDIAFRPKINVYGGRQSVQLYLEDWRPTA